jgi:hypothetical protein
MALDQGGAALPTVDGAPKKDEYKGWIKMTPDEMVAAQENGTLMGYHPAKGLGLVKSKEADKK